MNETGDFWIMARFNRDRWRMPNERVNRISSMNPLETLTVNSKNPLDDQNECNESLWLHADLNGEE